MLIEDKVYVNGLQPCLEGSVNVHKNTAVVRTSEMRFRCKEQKDRRGLKQVRPFLLETVYRLVIGESGPFLAIEVKIAGVYYKAASSVSQYSIMDERKYTEETH